MFVKIGARYLNLAAVRVVKIDPEAGGAWVYFGDQHEPEMFCDEEEAELLAKLDALCSLTVFAPVPDAPDVV